MSRCQPHDPGSLYVLSVASWLDWIMPFLSNGTAPAEVACWQRASAVPARLLASGSNPVILLSHHDTLLRDAAFAQGRSTVLAQPAAIARLAHDKRAMADVVGRVDGLRPIPQLTLIVSSQENLLRAMHRLLGAGLSSCRFVPATGHSVEILLPDGLSSCALAALRRLGDVHVSSRITMAAPTIEQLVDLRHLASRVLAEDGHDRAATLLVTG